MMGHGLVAFKQQPLRREKSAWAEQDYRVIHGAAPELIPNFTQFDLTRPGSTLRQGSSRAATERDRLNMQDRRTSTLAKGPAVTPDPLQPGYPYQGRVSAMSHVCGFATNI
jgi:hypothetical protein